MAEAVTIGKVYEEVKAIERNMVTKEDFDRILETIEILSNANTMEQIRASEEDIRHGRVKEIKSSSDI